MVAGGILGSVIAYEAVFNCGTACTGGAPPLREGLTLGVAHASSNPSMSVWYENLSIESVASTLTACDISFNVLTPAGNPATGADSFVVIWTDSTDRSNNVTFSTFGTCDGGSTPADQFKELSVEWGEKASSDPLTGDALVAYGSGPFSGNITATLE